MQRVIGLDIGSYSVKAVEIVNTFKSYEITNFYENVIPEIEEVTADFVIPACMEQLFHENKLEADRIITAMPGQYISSRVMSFNFSDSKKVETAVLAEVEDSVPYNLDDMIIDHQILGSMDTKTVALVVMTRKNFLKSFLDYLHRINIDPKLVDVDSLAFYNLSPYIEMDAGSCIGLVDVGHEKTSVCIVQDGVLRMFRSINLGGRYLSNFLARDLEVDYNEAQRIKHRISRVICEEDQASELTGDNKIIVERLTLAANAIVKELGRTLYAFKNWEKIPVSKMLLSGGTTRIKNFEKYLSDQLEVPVVKNRLDQTSLKIGPNLSEYMEIIPQSVAIGLRSVSSLKKYSQINLRRGEFAFVQNYESALKGANVFFRVMAVVLLLLFVTYGIMHFLYYKQIDQLQERYEKEYSATFPQLSKRFKSGYDFPRIRKEVKSQFEKNISQKRQAIDKFIDENTGSRALIVLKDISEKIPSTVKVDVTLYKYTTSAEGIGNIELKGETDGFASVASIIEALKSIQILSDVQEKSSGAKPGTDGKVIEFTITAKYVGDTVAKGKA